MKSNQVREWHLIPSIQNIAIIKTRCVFVDWNTVLISFNFCYAWMCLKEISFLYCLLRLMIKSKAEDYCQEILIYKDDIIQNTDTAANNVHLFCIYYIKECVCCKCLWMQQQQKNAILHLRMFAGNLQLW